MRNDVEAYLAIGKEKLRSIHEEIEGLAAGNLIVMDNDLRSGFYPIPRYVEHLNYETDARFILAIEAAGIFHRLFKHKYWRSANCILVCMGGVPSRACRRFIRRLSDDWKLPVYAFVDGDPYGISNVYRTLKIGSGNAAYPNDFFCVPRASFLGITPDDIMDYHLPTNPLNDVDIKRARYSLEKDPFILRHKQWQDAIEKMIQNGVKTDQRVLAMCGFNFLMDCYFPEKLNKPEKFLP